MLSKTAIKQICLNKNIKTSSIITIFHSRNSSNLSELNVVKSKIPNIDIPKITLNNYVWKNLDKWHDKTALTCAETGRSYLYSEVYKKSRALANFLHKFEGLNQGDTVAIVLPNVPEYPIIVLGAIEAGLKVTLVSPFYTADEITRQFLDSGTKLVFTLTNLWPTVNIAAKNASSLDNNLPIVSINHKKNQSSPAEAIKFEEIVEGNNKLQFNIETKPDDVILLPYSSGTTGFPKGVGLTMNNIVSNLHQINTPEFRITNETEGSHQDVLPGVLPMFHIFGLITVTLNILSTGCKLVTVPKFGSDIFLTVLEHFRPTVAFLVPPIVLMLLNNPNILPRHITQLRTIVSGAAPLGAADIERLHQKSNGKVDLLQGYGLTETSPTTHQQTKLIPNGLKLGGCGHIVPNTECKIISTDDEGNKIKLGPNQSGELFMRGPQVMKGYHNNAKATEEVLDSEGWFRTGDIAHYDDDGHFFITDRLKELIKVKGFQVAPAELEELLRDHPEIEDAAVIGVPHKEFGEVPKAFVVPKKDITIKSHNVQEYIAAKVAKYKQLTGGIVVLDSIPKSAAGKILRRQLKNL